MFKYIFKYSKQNQGLRPASIPTSTSLMKFKNWKQYFKLALSLGSVSGLTLIIIVFWVINYAPGILPEPLVELARQPDLVKYPEAKRCGDCHQEIYEAWKKSRHALSWVSEQYIKDSENRTKEKCLPCHIPVQVTPETKPEPRLNLRDQGIFCVPCHVKNGAMHGPHDLFAPPHPTKYDQDYNASRFCGACHEKTFKQWQATQVRDTCQNCHMPRATKRLTQEFPLNLLHIKRPVGDHRFLHGDLTPQDLSIQMKFDGSRLHIGLTNKTIPHHVPTADNGDPRVYLSIVLKTKDGKEWDVLKETISPQLETALPYQKEQSYKYRIGNEVQTADLKLEYKPAWSKERTLILEQQIARSMQ